MYVFIEVSLSRLGIFFFFWPGKGRVCCGDNFTLGICQSACQSLLTRSLQVAAKIDQTVIAGDRPTG